MSVAETVLRKLLNKIIDELHYKNGEINLKRWTSGGANYTSALYSVTITAPDKYSLKMFAKVADIDQKLREVMDLDIMFKTEQFVYSKLVKVYEEIQEKHNVSPENRFVFPKFYGGIATEGEETVVMEDLMADGYVSYSRFKSVDWEHAASAVECLAKFHALSFAYQKEDPENFAKDAEKVKCQMKDHSNDPNMMETWKKMMGAAIQATREEHRERLLKFLSVESGREDFIKFKKPLSTIVLCHGDYRISNLLFRRQDGVLKPIVVDYQTVHSGSPASDLLYLMFTGTDEEFRQKNYERLLDYYFSELSKALDRVSIDVNEVYPRETFDSELKEMLGPALRVSTVVLPLVLVEAEQAPTMAKIDSVDHFALSPSQLFAERFSGIVTDYVRWGAL